MSKKHKKQIRCEYCKNDPFPCGKYRQAESKLRLRKQNRQHERFLKDQQDFDFDEPEEELDN